MKKASAWYYNKGSNHIILDEIGVVISSGASIDIFKFNPKLTWERYAKSLKSGILSKGKKNLIALKGPPVKNPAPERIYPQSNPFPSKDRSSLIIGSDVEDYLEVIESEFPPGEQPLEAEELWKSERDKYMINLSKAETGDDGEVFSDNLFEEEYMSEL